jgi:hypothetical protein
MVSFAFITLLKSAGRLTLDFNAAEIADMIPKKRKKKKNEE